MIPEDDWTPDPNEFEETVARLAFAAPLVTPPPSLRDRVMASIRQKRRPSFVEEQPGILVHRGDLEDWAETPYPGVLVKRVAHDRGREMASYLLKMAAGSTFPNHTHNAEEQCLVLSGEVRFGTVHLRAGDFSKTQPGTLHGHVTTDTGCVLFIVASTHDKTLA